jgi:hypothetical protein
METKLTLKLEKDIIERIKLYAMQHKISLSSLTEKIYKNIIINEYNYSENELSPITNKYKGILKVIDKTDNDLKYEYLKEKYLK